LDDGGATMAHEKCEKCGREHEGDCPQPPGNDNKPYDEKAWKKAYMKTYMQNWRARRRAEKAREQAPKDCA